MSSVQEERGIDERYYHMLYELQTVDFTLLELDLFLDTHPYDARAIQQYNQFAQQQRQIAQAFEMEYGPLKHGSYSKVPWQWVETPWPWQV